VNNVSHLYEENKVNKLLKRVQNYIEVTNEKILNEGDEYFNLQPIMMIYSGFTSLNTGSPEFFKKLENMLLKEL
jgi:hypothetical protein